MPTRQTKSKPAGTTARKATSKRVTAASGASKSSLASIAKRLSTVFDASARLTTRTRALGDIGVHVIADRKIFNQIIGLIKDATANSTLRSQALSQLQAIAFDPGAFAPYRLAYMNALRSIRSDPDMNLRQLAFGTLAREKDPDTQALLLAGLKDPQEALLPPEKALQLLSYDPHAGAYEVAREIEKAPPNELARREALRVLGADPQSTGLFERILQNKVEPTDVRQIAASSLNQLAPQRMQKIARDMAMDTGESDDARAISLTALANFGDAGALSTDASLQENVQRIATGTTGAELQEAATKFKARYS